MGDSLIFIADSQPITRAGIAAIITEHADPKPAIEQFSDREKLLTRLQSQKPDILIIDFELFDVNTIRDLTDVDPAVNGMGVLVLTAGQVTERINKILDWGITCCILKSCERQELLDAVNAVAANRKYFCSGVLNVLLARRTVKRKKQANPDRITPAEQEIIQLIALGLTSKEIAARKKLSYHTIITHRKNIFRKLAINNSAELMLHAMNSGMIEALDFSI
jgi:DNA-binding NarL/FixJ family response regulator